MIKLGNNIVFDSMFNYNLHKCKVTIYPNIGFYRNIINGIYKYLKPSGGTVTHLANVPDETWSIL